MKSPREFEFQAIGLQFHPRVMSLAFAEAFEPGSVATFGGTRGTVVSHGGALYRLPNDLAGDTRDSELGAALKHLIALLPAFREAGATEFVLHFRRAFQGRCAEEFSREELQLLTALDCHLFYVAQEPEN